VLGEFEVAEVERLFDRGDDRRDVVGHQGGPVVPRHQPGQLAQVLHADVQPVRALEQHDVAGHPAAGVPEVLRDQDDK
jgi:hypothetical protein